MRYSNPKMLLYIAMADAYASAVEYNDKLLKECLKLEGYLAHPDPKHGNNRAGFYSDDAEMSAANAKVLVRYDEPFIPLMFANAYVSEFIRGGCRDGYSRKFQAILEGVSTGEELLAAIKPDSNKNGAAMRSVPFGVLPTIEEVLEAATLQARITHDTPEGRFSARAVALMSHAALYESTHLSALGNYCRYYLPKEDRKEYGHIFLQPWSEGPVKSMQGASVAITTVHAVVDVLARENSLLGILSRIIRWGGDTDSVAAIAWGIASARYQSEIIPLFMDRDLEGGSALTGAPYLLALGEQLMNKYK